MVQDPRRQQVESAKQLNIDAIRALDARRPDRARALLRQALAIEKKSAALWLNLAVAEQQLSDSAGELAAIEAALKLEPRSFRALLMKAMNLDRWGRPKEAAAAYGIALTQLPPTHELDGSTRQAVARAQEMNKAYAEGLNRYIRHELDSRETSNTKRTNHFIDVLLRRRRVYHQEPTAFHFPGLPAIEFYDEALFPWLSTLEAAAPDMLGELNALRVSDASPVPYITYPENVPLDQWTELNHSLRWSAFHFYHYGQLYEDNCRQCPKTIEALRQIPQPKVTGKMPAAMFSVLDPKTRIPPHTGVSNVRLVVHLPLIVPPDCRFRVGNEIRTWQFGKAWVFDDTIEHEAWNDSTEQRVILVCDIWNPFLSDSEKACVTEVLQAIDRFEAIESDFPAAS